VVAVIKPWNYPLEMIAWSLFPALLAGNTVVVKPSEKSAAVAMAFAEMASDLALPPGILNIIHGDGSTGSLLVQNDTVRFVSFTGSVRAGRQIAAECARRLIRCSLELGGNDAAIVLPDADLDLTANGLVWGAFCNGGQVCVGIKRAYVDQSIYPQLLEAISSRIRDLRPFVDVGPMVDEQQRDTVVEFVADAVSRGAQAITGVSDDGPLYFPPVVLTNVDPSSRLLSDECFGPVLPLVQVKSTEEAVALANKSNYGLGASIWTSNHDAARVLAGKLEVGMVWVNDVNVAFPQAVWGGLKNSGSSFELGAEAIRNYTTPKHYCDETSSDVRRAWWYPY
jgi:acyl-CoA reductase-like NAD-dependent aldehyde dehydrogenase